MAQALLNNLNNVTTEVFSVSSPQDTVDETSFDELLDMQTVSDVDVQEDSDDIADTASVQEALELFVPETLQSVISETELAAAIEISVDAVLETAIEAVEEAEEEIIEVKTEEIEEKADKDGDVLDDNSAITEDDIDENENEEDITITQDEAPTMNKQLQTTLEHPTAVIMLQTQTNLKTQISKNSDNQNSLSQNSSEKSSFNEKTLTVQPEKIAFIEPSKDQAKTSSSNVKTLKEIIDKNIVKELNIQSVSSSGSGEASTDLMQYQTPQEQAVKIMIQSDIKFDGEIKTLSASNTAKPVQVSADRIIEQISKQMESMYNTSKVNMVLNPESLGKVILQLVQSKEGLLAQFTVSNAEVQNLLFKGLGGLKETLLAHGINIDNIVIKLSESELNENDSSQDWTEQENSGGGAKGQGSRKQKQEKRNFEQMMFEINQG